MLAISLTLSLSTTLLCPAAFERTPRSAVLFVDQDQPAGGDGQAWSSAYDELFDALNHARSDPSVAQIWIAEGSYLPDQGQALRSDSFVLVSGVGLYGGFVGNEIHLDQRDPVANVTILSGDFAGNDGPNFTQRGDNAIHVVSGIDLAGPVTIDGLRIRSGHCDLAGSDLSGGAGLFLSGVAQARIAECVFSDNTTPNSGVGNFGAGLFVENGDAQIERCDFSANRGNAGPGLGLRSTLDGIQVRVLECTFTGNIAFRGGGALWSALGSPLAAHFCSLRVEGCTFTDNSAGTAGAMADFNTARLEIVDSTFQGNQAAQGAGALGVARTAGMPPIPGLILGCSFEGNQGEHGGALRSESANLAVLNTSFFGNRASSLGGGLANTAYGFGASGTLDLQNTVFSGNLAMNGGGLLVLDSPQLRIAHTTFAANAVSGQGGGVYVQGSAAQIEGSILWGNSDSGFLAESAQLRAVQSSLALNHSIVQGLTNTFGGQGNLGLDPGFMDLDGLDGVVGTGDDDLRIGNSSPAFDAADAQALPSDLYDLDGDADTDEPLPLDLDGDARIEGVGLDMGPYEWDCSGVECSSQNYCLSTSNSTGVAAKMSASGSASLAAADFVLRAAPVPDQPGLFFFGPSSAFVPLGDGFLCVGSSLARLPVAFAANQELVHAVDFNSPPGVAIVAGTLYFQAWYRDPLAAGSGFNLSDGLRVVFTP